MSTKSLFEEALGLCATPAEREKVQRLAVRLHLDEDAPEWAVLVLHAEARGLFEIVQQRRVDFAAQNDCIEEHLRRIGERLDQMTTKDAVVVVQQLNGKANDANWSAALNELLATAFGIAMGALLFCLLFTTRWMPTPIIIIGTVVVTLLLAAAGIGGVSWWRARRLGYRTFN